MLCPLPMALRHNAEAPKPVKWVPLWALTGSRNRKKGLSCALESWEFASVLLLFWSDSRGVVKFS